MVNLALQIITSMKPQNYVARAIGTRFYNRAKYCYIRTISRIRDSIRQLSVIDNIFCSLGERNGENEHNVSRSVSIALVKSYSKRDTPPTGSQ